jgi:ribosome maturation factor RimP
MSETVVEAITSLVMPVLQEKDLVLVDVLYRRESSGWVLRLFIDKEDGVTLDDCTAVSREVSHLLDIEDIIEQAFNLEVSSPGLDRPLKSIGDFQRFAGRKAKVTTKEPIEGNQVFMGRINKVEEELITMEVGQQELRIPFSEVAKARLEVEF